MDENQMQDICRYCRSEATPEKPLHHPCLCRGSIKFIHQECLSQWLDHSGAEYCELCNHRFSFVPIYSPDMPKRLLTKDIFSEFSRSLETPLRFCLHYIIVLTVWFGVIPLIACRIYQCLFTGSLSPILSLPLDVFFKDNISSDINDGKCVQQYTLSAFLCFSWLRELILKTDEPNGLALEQEVALPAGVAENGDDTGPNGDNTGPNGDNVGNNGAQANVNTWNLIEWDRVLRDINLLRLLLGRCSTLEFFKKIFWLIPTLTLFMVVFAFCPYHIGQFSMSCFGIKQLTSVSEFEGLLTTIFGYVNMGIVFALLYGAAAIYRLQKTRSLMIISCVLIEFFLIVPLFCGWLLDICSLTMLNTTIQDREAIFRLAPGPSVLIHWFGGIIYVFCFTNFILLLKKVLRPGVLWFLENLNDANFNPIQEMIQSLILRCIRQVIVLLVTSGTTILLVIWLPVSIIEALAPGFLPYHIMLSSSLLLDDLSLDMLSSFLLTVLFLSTLQLYQMRQWLKFFVRTWCTGVSHCLDIRSYLLGDINNGEQQLVVAATPIEDEAQGGFQADALGAVLQTFFFPVSPSGFQPYRRPRFLPFKIVCLIFCICISLTLGGLVILTVPVFVGRKLMSLLFEIENAEDHDLFNIWWGLTACWIMMNICTVMWNCIPEHPNTIFSKMEKWLGISFVVLCAMAVLVGLIPILLGLLFDLVLIIPSNVLLTRTPVISILVVWVIGLNLAAALCYALHCLDLQRRMIIDHVILVEIDNINLQIVFVGLVLPVIIFLGFSLSVPYIIACSITPMFSSSFEIQNLVLRRIYPVFFVFYAVVGAIVFLVRHILGLYERIKNNKYSVGKKLVDYEH